MPEKKSFRKKKFDKDKYLVLTEEMTFDQYLESLEKNPKLLRSSFQMILDMIRSRGYNTFELYKETLTHYNFFDEGDFPIFGLEKPLDNIVKFFKAAAGRHGTDKRFLLLHGPVGSSKSTICTHIKKGMESYSKTEEGKWYTFKWIDLPCEGEDGIALTKEDECPMHEQPLNLIPVEDRSEYVAHYNKVLKDMTPADKRHEFYPLFCDAELCPRCRKYMTLLLKKYKGDYDIILDKHIKVIRKVYSEADRMGIGTFQPKDEKNQDSTELNGDINFQKIATFGSDSDARSFNFDGEFQISNRGLVEFIEVLKLDVAFLYDLLGVTQEHKIKPKKFSLIDIDEIVIGHTNQPEYKRLKNNEFMQALRDRTVKIDIPYLTKWDHETSVLKYAYRDVCQTHHVAPHTFDIASFWAILTRLEDDKHGKLTLVQKAELYNGKMLPSYTEDQVKELIDATEEEAMEIGVSCRFVQDCIAYCLANNIDYINPFMVMNAIRERLINSPLITNKEHIQRYLTCVESALNKLENILKNEVQKAMVGDTEAIVRLCSLYIENVMAYIKKGTIKNPITQKLEKPNDRLMRDIERKIDIPDHGAPDFRREIAAFIGDLATQGKKFAWDSNQELKEALELKLFDDIKDTIKLSTMSAEGAMVVDPEQQAKLDALKARMIKWYGYNEKSATDVLDYVGSIWARGEATDQD